jgi:carbamoylphosphate synthase large subunit
MKILISDAENRKTFDIIHIALRHYHKKDLLIASNEQNWLLKVIYPGLKRLRTNIYHVFENDLKKIISEILDSESIVYLPIEETTTLCFYQFINENKELKNRFFFLLPSLQTFNLSRDKYLLNLFCIENKIAAPAIITNTDIDKLRNDFKTLIYKPKIGSGSQGIRIIKNKEELNTIQYDDSHFIQYFIGNGITVTGGFYLMNKGQLVSFYSHQRIRTYPPEGGVSVFAKSIQNKEIEKIGYELLNKLNWSGLAMIEFIYNEETDQYMIIEINPRVWGSILLSEINNSFFIKKYIHLSIGMNIEQTPFNEDTYIRWFVPWDIILYFKRRGKIERFWKFDVKKTVFIGFSYANLLKSIMFILYSILDFKHIKKIIGGIKL